MQKTKLLGLALIATFAFAACSQASETGMGQEHVSNTPEELQSSVITLEIEPPVAPAALAAYSAPEYKDYSSAEYKELLGNEPLAIFFHASWCPTCHAVDSQITSALSSYPDGTKILIADFDTERELKRTYGVNVQSTIVIIDKNGNKVKTLAAPSNNELINAINSTL